MENVRRSVRRSHSTAEHGTGSTPQMFLPFVLLGGPSVGKLGRREVLLLHWARCGYMVIFGLVYYLVITDGLSSRRLMSGALKEAMEEFFPDAAKTGERLTESEITPGFKELIHGDDVAKTLTWFQMFCMQKAGSDDHVPWAWSCDIAEIAMGQTHPVPWNIINNSEPGRGDWGTANSLLQHICSPGFLSRHMKHGDNPHKVYFGDFEAFQKVIKDEAPNLSNTEIDGSYDEFTVLSGNPMLTDIVQKGLEQDIELEFRKQQYQGMRVGNIASLLAVSNHRSVQRKAPILFSPRGSKMHGARIRPRPLQSRTPIKHLEPDAPHSESGGSNSLLAMGQFGSHTTEKIASSLGGADVPDGIPSWCYHRSLSPLLFLLRKLEEFDADNDNALDQEDVAKMADELSVNNFTLWKNLDQNKDNKVSLDDLKAFTKTRTYKDLFKKVRLLRSVCKNHHWGTLPVCGPEWIEVRFHIENANIAKDEGAYSRHAFADVTIRFEQVGYDPSNERSASSGWYDSRIRMDSRIFFGSDRSLTIDCSVIFVILFFVLLFLAEFIYTVLSWPLTIYKILAISRKSNGTPHCEEVFDVLRCLLDGRGVRSRFVDSFYLGVEFVFTSIFLFAVMQSCFMALQPSVPANDYTENLACHSAYERRLEEFLEKERLDSREDTSGLISPIQYINYCLDADSHNLFSEMMKELLFECGIGHSLAFLILMIRLSDMFYAFDRTSWVPKTITVLLPKLLNFIVFYVFIIGIFGMFFWVEFGSFFVQFRTFARSCSTLFLYSFGYVDRALGGVHTFEEYQSGYVTLYILIFSILVVSVFMQVFTTIVLGAYSIVHETDGFMQFSYDQYMLAAGFVKRYICEDVFVDENKCRKAALEKAKGYALHQLQPSSIDSQGRT